MFPKLYFAAQTGLLTNASDKNMFLSTAGIIVETKNLRVEGGVGAGKFVRASVNKRIPFGICPFGLKTSSGLQYSQTTSQSKKYNDARGYIDICSSCKMKNFELDFGTRYTVKLSTQPHIAVDRTVGFMGKLNANLSKSTKLSLEGDSSGSLLFSFQYNL